MSYEFSLSQLEWVRAHLIAGFDAFVAARSLALRADEAVWAALPVLEENSPRASVMYQLKDV